MPASETGHVYDAAAGYYDLFATLRGESALPSVGFFTSLAPADGDVLEVGAGTGRITLPIAERAARVHALEPSRAMRSVLLAKLADRSALHSKVTVLPLAAPSFRLGRQFDYALAAGVLQFFSPSQRREFFATLTLHLRRGGTLALDMVCEGTAPDWPRHLIEDVAIGECRYTLHCAATAFDQGRSRMSFTYTTWHNGHVIAEETAERDVYVHGHAEVSEDLEAHGFMVVNGTPAQSGCGESPDGGALVARLTRAMAAAEPARTVQRRK